MTVLGERRFVWLHQFPVPPGSEPIQTLINLDAIGYIESLFSSPGSKIHMLMTTSGAPGHTTIDVMESQDLIVTMVGNVPPLHPNV